jgi:hypothetical protein
MLLRPHAKYSGGGSLIVRVKVIGEKGKEYRVFFRTEGYKNEGFDEEVRKTFTNPIGTLRHREITGKLLKTKVSETKWGYQRTFCYPPVFGASSSLGAPWKDEITFDSKEEPYEIENDGPADIVLTFKSRDTDDVYEIDN